MSSTIDQIIPDPKFEKFDNHSTAHSTTVAAEAEPTKISVLVQQFEHLCAEAVEPFEVAAGLEAAGFTDDSAQDYGFADVFALAEYLYCFTSRVIDPEPVLRVNPWLVQPGYHLIRGVAFAAPGLLFISSLPGISSMAERLILVLALLLGWSLSQVLASGYSLLSGRRCELGGQAFMRMIMLIAAGIATMLVGFGYVTGQKTALLSLAGGEIMYLVSSSIVISIRQLKLALIALLPGVTTALISLWQVPRSVIISGSGLSLVLACTAALWVTRRPNFADLSQGLLALTSNDKRILCWQGGYGITAGAMVSLPTMTTQLLREPINLLPMIWATGFAEWQIMLFRRSSFELLQKTTSLGDFRALVKSFGWKCLRRYVLVIVVLSTVMGLGQFFLHDSGLSMLASLLVGGLTAVVFYLALVISSMSATAIVVLRLGISALIGMVLLIMGHQYLACTAPVLIALVLLVGPYLSIISDPTRHM